MIHTILWAIYFILYLIIVSPMHAYYAHQIKKGNREKVQAGVDRMVHNWAHRLLWMAGAKVIVDGKENIPQGTAVFVANHQSNFDIPVVLACVGQPRDGEGFAGKNSGSAFLDGFAAVCLCRP